MDINTWMPFILAIVAIVPGVWALVNQAKKDAKQAKIDQAAAAQQAAINIIAPLQAEVTRLQARVLVLENEKKERDDRIDVLEAAIDEKDNTIRTLKFSLDDMKMRLETMEKRKQPQRRKPAPKKPPVTPPQEKKEGE